MRGGGGKSPVVLICEHASNRLPEPWSWPDEDRWLVNTHWAIDLGIAGITRALADELGCTAVLSRFSRLLIDPNRKPGSPDLFRDIADGREVALNTDISDEEKAERIGRLYQPYHDAVDAVMAEVHGCFLLSMHSFTPVYEGAPPRWMDVGILFDHEDALAQQVAPVVRRHGLVTALNEPYTGKGGLMYAAQSHAARNHWRALEVEVRQDRATNPSFRRPIVQAMADLCRYAVDVIENEGPSFTEEVSRTERY